MDGPERAAAAQAAAAAVIEVNSTAEAVSRIIRGRVRRGLSVLGPAGDASMAAVDATHDCAHRAIRGATAALGSVGAELLEATTPEDAPSLVGDAERAHLVAGLGAAFGDRLPEALAPPMRWRTERGEVAMNRVAVFIHGLGGHDRQWSTDYLDTMRSAGITPVLVQYTTGRPVAINGLQFDELLDQLVQEWPVEIAQLIIVAHSMGGLVTANAFEHASDGRRWPGRVTDVVTLGTPHKGAPLNGCPTAP
jgi:triacylglycerol esterase/lipase EstA (alpha/beta hydrolase family)